MASKKEVDQDVRRRAEAEELLVRQRNARKERAREVYPTMPHSPRSEPRPADEVWARILSLLGITAKGNSADAVLLEQAEAIFLDHVSTLEAYTRQNGERERLAERSSHLPRPKTAHRLVKNFLINTLSSQPQVSLKVLRAQLLELATSDRRPGWLLGKNGDSIIYVDDDGRPKEMPIAVINDSWLSRNRPKQR